jgi:hypothetical protein
MYIYKDIHVLHDVHVYRQNRLAQELQKASDNWIKLQNKCNQNVTACENYYSE